MRVAAGAAAAEHAAGEVAFKASRGGSRRVGRPRAERADRRPAALAPARRRAAGRGGRRRLRADPPLGDRRARRHRELRSRRAALVRGGGAGGRRGPGRARRSTTRCATSCSAPPAASGRRSTGPELRMPRPTRTLETAVVATFFRRDIYERPACRRGSTAPRGRARSAHHGLRRDRARLGRRRAHGRWAQPQPQPWDWLAGLAARARGRRRLPRGRRGGGLGAGGSARARRGARPACWRPGDGLPPGRPGLRRLDHQRRGRAAVGRRAAVVGAVGRARRSGCRYSPYAVDGATAARRRRRADPGLAGARRGPERATTSAACTSASTTCAGSDWDPAAFAATSPPRSRSCGTPATRVLVLTIPLDLGRPRAGAKVEEANAVIESEARATRRAGRRPARLRRAQPRDGRPRAPDRVRPGRRSPSARCGVLAADGVAGRRAAVAR